MQLKLFLWLLYEAVHSIFFHGEIIIWKDTAATTELVFFKE